MSADLEMVDGTRKDMKLDGDETHMLYEAMAGSIICTNLDTNKVHSTNGCCKHVDRYIKEGYDREAMWLHRPIFDRITVPLAWQHSLSTEVHVMPPGKFSWDDGLLVMYAEHDNPDRPGQSEEIELGILRKGEGRQYIRESLINWFAGVMDEGVIQCKSTSHSMGAQIAWEQEIASSELKNQARFVQYWSVWSTGQCRVCREGDDIDYSAFVPDKEDTSFRPPSFNRLIQDGCVHEYAPWNYSHDGHNWRKCRKCQMYEENV